MNKKKRIKKEGQITIFVIIAVMLIVIIAGIIFINYINQKNPINTAEISPISEFIMSCIKDNGNDAVRSIGVYGGYFEIGYATEGGTPYYYDNGKYLMPSKEEIENQLSLYMNSYLNNCSFADFSDFQITKGKIITIAQIENEKVTFNVKYPLTIKKDSRTYLLKNFKNIIIPVRLGVIYSSVKDFMNQSESHEGGICLSCLYDIGEKNDLYAEIYDYDSNTVLFIIRDRKILIYNEPYQFNFAGKYPQAKHLLQNKTS